MEKKLAKIRSATLNIKDRGILTFWVMVDYEDGCSQGVGGLTLDNWDEDKQSRVGTAYGCEMIRQLLLFFNVDNLQDCKGQYVYVLGEGKGLAFTPKGFEKLYVDDFNRKQILFPNIFDEFGDKE